MRQLKNQSGFTLIELLIAMVVSGMIVSATVTVFRLMIRDYNTTVRTMEMQQNLRTTMNYMERYIRMAGYDPTELANAGFTTMLSHEIAFTMNKGSMSGTDLDTTSLNNVIDNHWEEQVAFRLDDGDKLYRVNSAGANQLLAKNIEALNFVYLDRDGKPTSDADDVASVQVTIIAKYGENAGYVTRHNDSQTYRNQQGAVILPAQNDNMRRMMLTADVNCRNLRW